MNLPSQVLPVTEPPADPAADVCQTPKPEVEQPGLGRTISEFAADVGQILGTKNLLLRDRVLVQWEEDKLQDVTPDEFITLAEEHMSIGVINTSNKNTRFVPNSMKVQTARTVLAAGRFLNQIRSVKRLNLAPLPVMRTSGEIQLLPIGYDSDSQTLTMQSGFSLRTDMPLEAAKAVIDGLLKEFPFNDEGRSKGVVVSAMMNFFASGLLKAGAIRPVFILSANAEGAGKSLLAMVCV